MKQNFIKSEMSLQILHNTYNSENVELILIDQKDKGLINWKDENEFMYDGRMYDLISQEFVGNQIQLYAIQDKKEATLESAFKSFMLSLLDQKDSKEDNTCSFKIFQKDFYFHHVDAITKFLETSFWISKTNYHFSNISVHLEVTSPPPKYSFHLI